MSQYPCPQCQKTLVWNPSNIHRPFCSERCQQLDLGAWASGAYAIPGDELENDFSSALLESAEQQD
ncbi:MAG: DNA gyrase inhibitor YacG [Gammaproteobacteria bacterium]|nr:DNA gyrase inhibitor YacG [Gammaproteobacteria bacterium]